MDTVVRLQSVELKNIKNVKAGRIEMPGYHKISAELRKPELLGLYGQNGSGKTAVIDALYFLQRIMSGESLDSHLADYINAEEQTAEITAEFAIFTDGILYETVYQVTLCRAFEGRPGILRETLSRAKHSHDGVTGSKRAVFMEYDNGNRSSIFIPKKRLDELLSENREYKMDLLVAKRIAEKSRCSFIFGENSREIFRLEYHTPFQEYSVLIDALYRFASEDLFVIRNSHSGVISANLVLPMAFRIEKENGEGLKGDFTVSLTGPTLLDQKRKEILYRIIEEINTVLHTIIPGMKIGIRDYGVQLTDSGREGARVELVSVRDGIEIPIRMESEGIIKIISILNALIHAFGDESVCLAVDELDAGIYEYMLGELLDVFQKSARGGMIFTSHNLRALEMLNRDSILFSTSNPYNRYVRMKPEKAPGNLRDAYLRSITLGGQREEIYQETDSLRMARAFRKAGRSIRYEE